MARVDLGVDLDAVVAVKEEVAAASVEDSGLDDGQVDATLNPQDLADQEAGTQIPSVVVHVVASVEVDLEEVRRLLAGKDLCIHQIVVAVADAAFAAAAVDVDAVAAVADADADDVAAELVVVRQSNHHAVTCIEHELRQHDGVLQPVPLLLEPCPRLLWLYDEPTIRPCSLIVSRCEESYVSDRLVDLLP